MLLLPTTQSHHIILVVDDTASTRTLLTYHLQEAGYIVWSAANGQEALQQVTQYGLPDLALLDLHLPDLPGPTLAAVLQQQGSLPILWLGQEQTAAGAANLVHKPIVRPQLLRQVAAHLTAGDASPASALGRVRVDEQLLLNFSERYALLNSRLVELTAGEWCLLEHFVSQRGVVLSHQFLRDQLRKVEPDRRCSLETYIYQLRQKLETHAIHRRYICNVFGQGYMMPLVPLERLPAVPITLVHSNGRRRRPTPLCYAST